MIKQHDLDQIDSNMSIEQITFFFDDNSYGIISFIAEDHLFLEEDEREDDEEQKKFEAPSPPPQDPRIVELEQKRRLHDFRVSYAAAELCIPAAQVLYSVLRASLISK